MLGVLSSSPAQAVLQQLVRAGGAGSRHQAHGGFMQEHLGTCRGDTPVRTPADACPGGPFLHTTLPCPALPMEATSVLTLTSNPSQTPGGAAAWGSSRSGEPGTGWLAGGSHEAEPRKRQRAAPLSS